MKAGLFPLQPFSVGIAFCGSCTAIKCEFVESIARLRGGGCRWRRWYSPCTARHGGRGWGCCGRWWWHGTRGTRRFIGSLSLAKEACLTL
eukprot:7383949-Prymnesium_polylepis.2